LLGKMWMIKHVKLLAADVEQFVENFIRASELLGKSTRTIPGEEHCSESLVETGVHMI